MERLTSTARVPIIDRQLQLLVSPGGRSRRDHVPSLQEGVACRLDTKVGKRVKKIIDEFTTYRIQGRRYQRKLKRAVRDKERGFKYEEYSLHNTAGVPILFVSVLKARLDMIAPAYLKSECTALYV
jgi:hypothetical protein